MKNPPQPPPDDELTVALVRAITDGFNRSLNALEELGALDCRELRGKYGPGTSYYDAVTTQIESTARSAADEVRALIRHNKST